MGLFDFALDSGEKLFGDEEAPASQSGKIKGHPEKDTPRLFEDSRAGRRHPHTTGLLKLSTSTPSRGHEP